MTSFKKRKLLLSKNPRSLVSKRKFSAIYGVDTVSFKGPQIWQDLARDIKNSDSLNLFKSNIKRYGNLTCHCKLLLLFWVILINPVTIKSFYY